MSGYIDLHCHWLPAIDDGARTLEEGVDMLRKLRAIGFDTVLATPHMRPGLFDNDAEAIRACFEATAPHLHAVPDLPERDVSSEHYFDDVVFERLRSGAGVPYPGGRAALLEFYEIAFPPSVDRCFAALLRAGIRPVIAHPERYQAIRRQPEIAERIVDLGVVCLLDTAALVGKYGQSPQACAIELLERGLYHAACSDAHRPADVAAVAEGMAWIAREFGPEELHFLMHRGPREILAGRVPTDVPGAP